MQPSGNTRTLARRLQIEDGACGGVMHGLIVFLQKQVPHRKKKKSLHTTVSPPQGSILLCPYLPPSLSILEATAPLN